MFYYVSSFGKFQSGGGRQNRRDQLHYYLLKLKERLQCATMERIRVKEKGKRKKSKQSRDGKGMVLDLDSDSATCDLVGPPRRRVSVY